MKRFSGVPVILGLLAVHPVRAQKQPSEKTPTLDQYVQQVNQRAHQSSNASPGSLYTSNGRLADGFRDVRASQMYDLVTIVVSDSSSAVSTGVTNTSRKSSAQSSITSLFGPKSATGALANLTNTSGNTQLQGQGQPAAAPPSRPP